VIVRTPQEETFIDGGRNQTDEKDDDIDRQQDERGTRLHGGYSQLDWGAGWRGVIRHAGKG